MLAKPIWMPYNGREVNHMKTPKSWKTIEIEQQLRFGAITIQTAEKMLQDWASVRDYACIVHDKDTMVDGSPKPAHIHMMVRFKDSVPTTAILAKLNKTWPSNDPDKPNFTASQLEKTKGWKNAIAYLTHANARGKYLYPDIDVHSNYEWQEDRKDALARKALVKDPYRAEEIVTKIADGSWREYNLNENLSPMEQAVYQREIKTGTQFRKRSLMAEEQRELYEGREAKMVRVFWVSGEAGSGKTAFAKLLATRRSLDYFISGSGSDFLDGYAGQPALILDDIRPDNVNAEKLIKMLDPHTRSSVASRYSNKWLEVKTIIVTTPLGPEEFWYAGHFDLYDGKVEQLLRRINSGWYHFTWDPDKQTGNTYIRMYNQAGLPSGSRVYKNLMAGFLIQWSVKAKPDAFADLTDDLPGFKLEPATGSSDLDQLSGQISLDDNPF